MSHISADEYSPGLIRDAASLIYDYYNKYEYFELASVIDEVEDEQLKEFLLKCALEDHNISKSWEKLFPNPDTIGIIIKMTTDSVRKFKIMQIDRLIAETALHIKSAVSEEELLEYLKTQDEFNIEKKKLTEELV